MPILLVATFLVWWLYFARPNEDWTKRLISIMGALRWIVITVIAALLLQPYFIQLIEEQELPKLLIYADHSKSVSSSEYAQIDAWASELQKSLQEKYDVEIKKFGAIASEDTAQINPFETDLGAVIESANQDFYGDNIGAIVIASDGIQTTGLSPMYVPLLSPAPIFTIGLGDSSSQSDIEVIEVLANRIAFLDNDIQIKTRIKSSLAQGENISVSLLKNGEQIDSKDISIEKTEQGFELSFLTRADRIGQNKFTIALSAMTNERNTLNNRKSAFVDVLDNRTKIQVIANAPHPDVAAIKRSIETSNQYEVEVVLFDEWDRKVESVDLFILHGVPSNGAQVNAINKISKASKPSWHILTSQTDLASFNSLSVGFSIEGRRQKSDEITGRINADFSLFNLPEFKRMKSLPPLLAPFGDYRLKSDLNIALFQQFGDIETERPLLAFSSTDGVKNGVLSGEGIWRWRLTMKEDDNWVQNVIRKSVQFLALRQKRTRLEVEIPPIIEEQLDVVVKAEAYNESFELTSNAEVKLSVNDSMNNQFDYTLRPKGQSFELNLGKLPPGDYSWKAEAEIAEEFFGESGGFIVNANVSEYQRTQADFELLTKLAERNDGSFFQLTQLADLSAQLGDLESAKPVIHSSDKWRDITELKWLAIVLIVILATEWFLRKFNGSV